MNHPEEVNPSSPRVFLNVTRTDHLSFVKGPRQYESCSLMLHNVTKLAQKEGFPPFTQLNEREKKDFLNLTPRS